MQYLLIKKSNICDVFVNTCVITKFFSRCFPCLFLINRDQLYSPTTGTDLQRKFNHALPLMAAKVKQVGHKWQSNHYKAEMESTPVGEATTEAEEQVSPRTNRVISTFRGSPGRRSGL